MIKIKLYELLGKWAFLMKSASLYHELKYYVKRKSSHICKLYMFNSRGIGKTHSLMKLSGKYKIPVLEPSENSKWLYCKKFKEYRPIIITPNDIKNHTLENCSMILVDDLQYLDSELRRLLNSNYIQIGFETISY